MSKDMLGQIVRKLVDVPAEAHGTLIDLLEKLAGPEGKDWLVALKQLLRKEVVRAPRIETAEAYTIRLGGPETTDEIVRGLKKGGLWVDDYITQKNFSLQPHDQQEVVIEILDPDRDFNEAEGLKLLAAAGLERPTTEHALRFAEQFGKTTTGKKPFIVFLHEPYLAPDGPRRVLYVYRYLAHCGLSLLYVASRGWRDGCVLAGVRPRSPR